MIDLKIGNLYKTTKDTVVHVRHSDDYHQTTWLRNNIVVVVMSVEEYKHNNKFLVYGLLTVITGNMYFLMTPKIKRYHTNFTKVC